MSIPIKPKGVVLDLIEGWRPIEVGAIGKPITVKATKHCLKSGLMVGDKLTYKNNSSLTATVHDLTDDGLVILNVMVLGKKELAEHTVREINLLFNRERK